MVNHNGERIAKRDFKQRCGICAQSTEPGWLWLGKGDWVKCPFCEGKGWVTGTETRIDPTRKHFIVSSTGGS